MARFTLLITLAGLTACETLSIEELGLDSATPEETIEIEVEETIDHAEIVAIWLEGSFSTSVQAEMDSNYEALFMEACRLQIPELGSRVLYVEQTILGAANRVQSQKLYSIDEEGNRVAMRSFAMRPELEAALVGACDAPEAAEIDLAMVAKADACTLWITPEGEDQYGGGTVGTECTTPMDGVDYETAYIVVEPLGIELWERGWNSEDRQVWGPENGPYQFERVR